MKRLTAENDEEIVALNGALVPAASATVSIDDRGFLFGDGAYEVIRVYHGKLFRLREHLGRLLTSCRGLEIALPQPTTEPSCLRPRVCSDFAATATKAVLGSGIREYPAWPQGIIEPSCLMAAL